MVIQPLSSLSLVYQVYEAEKRRVLSVGALHPDAFSYCSKMLISQEVDGTCGIPPRIGCPWASMLSLLMCLVYFFQRASLRSGPYKISKEASMFSAKGR